VRALRCTAAAALLPDHAAGSAGRVGAAVILGDGESKPAPFRVNGVAGAVGDDDLDLTVSGIDDVVAPADARLVVR